MNFYKKDELGIEREYSVITEYEKNNSNYVIYTDFVSDKENEFRLFVGSIINNKVERVNNELERIIITEFKNKEKEILSQLKERFL